MRLDNLREYFGIYLIAFWAVVLGLQNATRLFLISQSDTVLSNDASGFLVAYRWVSVIFSLAFLVAAVGLWRRENWGRLLFMVVAVLFFIVSIIGLLTPQANGPSVQEKWFLGIRYVLSAIFPVVYLNLVLIKSKFKPISTESRS